MRPPIGRRTIARTRYRTWCVRPVVPRPGRRHPCRTAPGDPPAPRRRCARTSALHRHDARTHQVRRRRPASAGAPRSRRGRAPSRGRRRARRPRVTPRSAPRPRRAASRCPAHRPGPPRRRRWPVRAARRGSPGRTRPAPGRDRPSHRHPAMPHRTSVARSRVPCRRARAAGPPPPRGADRPPAQSLRDESGEQPRTQHAPGRVGRHEQARGGGVEPQLLHVGHRQRLREHEATRQARPHRRALRRPSPTRCAGPRGRRAIRAGGHGTGGHRPLPPPLNRTTSADTTNDTALRASAAAGLSVATSSPPTAKPPTWAAWPVTAARRARPRTPDRARRRAAAPCAAVQGGEQDDGDQQRAQEGSGVAGRTISATSRARTRSQTIMTWRRGCRSASRPSRTPPTSAGRNVSA